MTLDEAVSGRQVVHTPSELREHFRKIGDAESVVAPEVLSRLPPDRTCADYLAVPPSDEEIRRVWRKMRDSAGGPDEVTINMLRYSGQTLQDRFFDLVRRLWKSPGSWEPSVHAAEVLALFKKKDRAKVGTSRQHLPCRTWRQHLLCMLRQCGRVHRASACGVICCTSSRRDHGTSTSDRVFRESAGHILQGVLVHQFVDHK